MKKLKIILFSILLTLFIFGFNCSNEEESNSALDEAEVKLACKEDCQDVYDVCRDKAVDAIDSDLLAECLSSQSDCIEKCDEEN